MLLTCILKIELHNQTHYLIKHIITKPCNKTYLLWDTDFGNKKCLLHSLSMFWNKIRYLQYQKMPPTKITKNVGSYCSSSSSSTRSTTNTWWNPFSSPFGYSSTFVLVCGLHFSTSCLMFCLGSPLFITINWIMKSLIMWINNLQN